MISSASERWAAVAETGGLLEGIGNLEQPPFLVVRADDLDAD
jgi:hypothetical protein